MDVTEQLQVAHEAGAPSPVNDGVDGEEPANAAMALIKAAAEGDGGAAVARLLADGADPNDSMIGTVRALRGRSSALRVLRSKSSLHYVFVWVSRALNGPKRRFPARAGSVGEDG